MNKFEQSDLLEEAYRKALRNVMEETKLAVPPSGNSGPKIPIPDGCLRPNDSSPAGYDLYMDGKWHPQSDPTKTIGLLQLIQDRNKTIEAFSIEECAPTAVIDNVHRNTKEQ